MERKFYDIHCHAMNMAHPNILAFIRRLNWQLLLLATPLLAPLAAVLGKEAMKSVQNLLTVMENDTGSFFMLVEHYLKNDPQTGDLLQDDRLVIAGQGFEGIVLTPLLMDFGCKNIKTETYYCIPPQKPIVSQAEDVLSGIVTYGEKELHSEERKGQRVYWIDTRKNRAIFQIYPFLGLNTKNYDNPEHLTRVLEQFFGDYRGREGDFRANLGSFTGDIRKTGSNFFAGIKLYPPIGFDPWPDEGGATDERAKVACLYRFCCDRQIPVTVHCSDGGFELDERALEFSCPERWAQVLSQPEFGTLKLNFAHFGKQTHKKYLLFRQYEWRDRILGLIGDYPNVYTDFSYLGLDDGHYRMLAELCEKHPLLGERLLFGSDFMINLLAMESYNHYLGIFAKTQTCTAAQKLAFCSTNPERFLWRDGV